MSATTSSDPIFAASPFDHAKADIILRSSDNVDFRVFKLFLSLASSFFETLCFAIACRGQLEEETQLAARYTLTQPLIPPWFKEISLITAADLLALLTYHRECGDAVFALSTDMSWIRSHYGNSQGCAWFSGKGPDSTIDFYGRVNHRDCPCPRSSTAKYRPFESSSPQWWEDFMEKTFEALRDKPCRATMESIAAKTVQSVKACNCSTCSPNISEGMRDFSDLLAGKINEAVSQIKLDFALPR